MRLKPIGEGSDAERCGYDFNLVISWLESIRDSELEKSETKRAYTERAHKLSDLVDELQSLS